MECFFLELVQGRQLYQNSELEFRTLRLGFGSSISLADLQVVSVLTFGSTATKLHGRTASLKTGLKQGILEA